jgi:hypothetical protein
MGLQNINLWAVSLAAIANVVIGSFWYSPFIFGKNWMHEKGFTEEDFKHGHSIRLILFLSFLFGFVGALSMAFLLTPESTTLSGAGMGAMVSFVWITASKANTALFENTSVKLILIHAGYDMIGYMVMGAILGALN